MSESAFFFQKIGPTTWSIRFSDRALGIEKAGKCVLTLLIFGKYVPGAGVISGTGHSIVPSRMPILYAGAFFLVWLSEVPRSYLMLAGTLALYLETKMLFSLFTPHIVNEGAVLLMCKDFPSSKLSSPAYWQGDGQLASSYLEKTCVNIKSVKKWRLSLINTDH